MPDEPCDPPAVPFFRSHRFWSAVVAAAGVVTSAVPTVTTIHPVAGLVVKLVGLGLTVAGAAGSAYFGITSNRHVEWKVPEPIKRQFKRNGGPPLAPQP